MSSRRPKSPKSIRKHWAPFFWEKKNFDSELEFVEEKDTCFACGLNWEGFDNPLEGAHIIARVHGGGDEVDNLILLCRCCHKAQENNCALKNREDTLRWVLERTPLDAKLCLAAVRGAHLSQILKPLLDLERKDLP